MNKYLYLLRHAKADPWSPSDSDFARALSEKGVRHARVLADWMKENLEAPDTVLCSPARRARETLAPLLSRWPRLRDATDYTDGMYGASLDQLIGLVADAFSYSDRLLIAGHNPGLHQLLVYSLDRETAREIHKMPTGALAVIGFPRAFERDRHDGTLLHFKRKKDLALN